MKSVPAPRRKPASLAATALVAAILLLPGCATPPRVQLNQPFAPPSQRFLALTPATAATTAADGRRAVLVGFTLPGATSGVRAYSLYLTFDDAAGHKPVDDDAEDAARGFFLQEVGQLKGKSVCAAGEIRYEPAGLLQPEDQLTLDVRCEDGTYLYGAVPLRTDPAAVRAFERRYAGDLLALRKSAPSPADSESPEATAPRRAAARASAEPARASR
jgi:hypothetical protein